MEYAQLNSAGGALLGVALANYAQGKLGIVGWVVNALPVGHIAVNAAAGIAVMNLIGEAPLDARTVVIGGGVAVAYNVVVGMLSADLQAKLNGN